MPGAGFSAPERLSRSDGFAGQDGSLQPRCNLGRLDAQLVYQRPAALEVLLQGVPPAPTQGPDALTGTPLGDRLRGLGGNDVLSGRAGDDCLEGGAGRDRLSGGSGRDRLSGNDRLSGGSGRKAYSAGSGNDRVSAANRRRERVSCGSGRRDSATVDRADRVRGCEG